MALKRRCPDVGLLHHSDQGCTYASEDYQTILEARGIVCSMSRRGNCYDNAVMESFFSTVKSELGEHFDSHGHAKMEVFDYIEVFYNQRRRHSTLGQISPAAYRAAGGARDRERHRRARGDTPASLGGRTSFLGHPMTSPFQRSPFRRAVAHRGSPSTTVIAPSCARPLSPWGRSAASSPTRLVLARSPPSACRAYEPPRRSERAETQIDRMGQRGQHN